MNKPKGAAPRKRPAPQTPLAGGAKAAGAQQEEHGGPAGPDPVRYGDWERGGIAVDF